MTYSPTEKELQDFALDFPSKIIAPLTAAGYDAENVFKILGIERQELRHSDFLAFLFDPHRSHDIGEQFLRNFLTLLVQNYDQLDSFSPNLLSGNFDQVNVYRELAIPDGRLDLLLEITQPQKIVIVIENKIDSEQHDKQLEKYKNYLQESPKYRNYRQVMLYLTIDQREPDCPGWLPIDYGFIDKVIDRVNTAAANDTIKLLISDYKKSLGVN